MDAGTYAPTYSGTPQGGIASPIVANIALHELDCWLEDELGANPPPLTAKQQNARSNPDYVRLHKRSCLALSIYTPGQPQTPEHRYVIWHKTLPRRSLAARTTGMVNDSMAYIKTNWAKGRTHRRHAMITLGDVFRRYGPLYRAQFGDQLPTEQAQAMRAIEQCRTEALGGQVYTCEACATTRYSYHSCRNRHSPRCSTLPPRLG
jgi:hypothetical protein